MRAVNGIRVLWYTRVLLVAFGTRWWSYNKNINTQTISNQCGCVWPNIHCSHSDTIYVFVGKKTKWMWIEPSHRESNQTERTKAEWSKQKTQRQRLWSRRFENHKMRRNETFDSFFFSLYFFWNIEQRIDFHFGKNSMDLCPSILTLEKKTK